MSERLTAPALADEVARRCFPDVNAPDRVGLELELLPFRGVRDRLPVARVPLDGPDGSRPVLDVEAAGGRWCTRVGDELRLVGGGALTFEPGGQVELAPGVADDVDEACEALERLVVALQACLGADGILLASSGVDLWTDRRLVPQQLDRPRYRAMDRHLAARGPWGRVMMRHTASLQVNLDPGGPDRRDERWTVANLLAPLCTATFAASPVERLGPEGAWSAASERAVAWQRLDPTRTGLPSRFVAGDDDPVGVMVDAARRADVLFVVDADGGAGPGRPGWTFGDWLDGDGPRPVTTDDLAVHLSTLFHDVRPRGPFELRTVDALPRRWRDVPVVLLAGALYDDEAASRIRGLLEPVRHRLPALSRQAARTGLKDPSLCALAVEAWSFALDGARRIGVATPRRRLTEDFLEAHTLRGRTVADDLVDVGPAIAFALCREPTPVPDTVDAP